MADYIQFCSQFSINMLENRFEEFGASIHGYTALGFSLSRIDSTILPSSSKEYVIRRSWRWTFVRAKRRTVACRDFNSGIIKMWSLE